MGRLDRIYTVLPVKGSGTEQRGSGAPEGGYVPGKPRCPLEAGVPRGKSQGSHGQGSSPGCFGPMRTGLGLAVPEDGSVCSPA
jgi:hypothetical protein